MTRKLIILAGRNFFDFQKSKIGLGGVETYIRDLALLGKDIGFSIEIRLLADFSKTEKFSDRIFIHGIPAKNNQQLLDGALRDVKSTNDRIVVSTDQMDIRSTDSRVIQVQHGIAFDGDNSSKLPKLLRKFEFCHRLLKVLQSWKNTNRLRNVPNTVCVDYNFFNWIRTQDRIPDYCNIHVIPNYSSKRISEEELDARLKSRSRKKIIFARRFVEYRGTLIFADVVETLLEEFPNLEVTFAGDGPLKAHLHDKFRENTRVAFSSFSPENSVDFHKDFDVAVIPTIFSEGTSLSLLEAMSAGCFPISTHVGGLTNILIDGYNGFMCYPKTHSLLNACRRALMISNEDFFRIRETAYRTAVHGFSLASWRKRWMDVLGR